MKRFFTRACARIARFFWSWGFLKFVVAMIALVIFFYVEEDWRGARMWAATQAEWEAKGESFDYNKFIPPPVPDDQNLAALPLFELGPTKYDDGTSYLGLVTLQRAMRTDLPGHDLPPEGNWPLGELPDMAKIRSVIATDYAAAFRGAKLPDDTFAQFDALYPFFTDFVAAAATRPAFRINLGYKNSQPNSRPLSPLGAQIKLSKILTLHAILALDHHQSDLALDDIKINYELISGVKRDPSLVSGLAALGIAIISNAAFFKALAEHDWSDAQLIEIDHTLRPINFLADYQFAIRSELVQSIGKINYYEELSHRNNRSVISFSLGFFWSDGWWDDNKRHMAAFLFQSLTTVDPQARLVFPKSALDLQNHIEQSRARWDAYAPWNIFSSIMAGPTIKSMNLFARGQVWIDEARIACALERYRLAHGVYPGSLDALAPTYIDEVPHDIMNGQPYHYQLRADGTYLLYSVGWNQTDDGGKVVFEKNVSNHIDYTQGDWVWPTPQVAPAK